MPPDHLPRRLTQLGIGLFLYGLSITMLVKAGLGVLPWDVLHQGVAGRTELTLGQITVVVAGLVLLAWWPLRQRPGLGTVANAVLIGVAVDVTMPLVGHPGALPGQVGLVAAGILTNALATALYIGAGLGPGPRDGLMTGLVARTGWSLRLVRTGLEAGVVVIGFALGGVVGLGTVAYAVLIGPLVQVLLPRATIRGSAGAVAVGAEAPPPASWVATPRLRPRPRVRVARRASPRPAAGA
jgi:uncharacterized membrane protein YczE